MWRLAVAHTTSTRRLHAAAVPSCTEPLYAHGALNDRHRALAYVGGSKACVAGHRARLKVAADWSRLAEAQGQPVGMIYGAERSLRTASRPRGLSHMVSTQALADAKDHAARHCPTEAARVDSEAEEEVPEEHEETDARSGESCGVRIDQEACVTKGVQARADQDTAELRTPYPTLSVCSDQPPGSC